MEAEPRGPGLGRRLGLTAALGLVVLWSAPSTPGTPFAAASASLAACPGTAGQIIRVSVPSLTYGAPIMASVYLPPCYDQRPGKLPAIYLLHGGNADDTQWPDLRVQAAADALIAAGAAPFVVVMPGGAYRANVDYGAFILTDLLPAMEQRLRIRSDAAGRAIGGLSLGGYWALKLAFERPGLFAAVGGHSPVVARGGPDDPLSLAHTAEGLLQLRVTLDAGDGDALRFGAAQLADALRARGVRVGLSLHPGAHNRAYWRAHTAEYLRFYLAALAPPRCRRGPH